MDAIIRDHIARYGWNRDLAWEVRTGVHVLLGFQPFPVAPDLLRAGLDSPDPPAHC